MAEMNAPADHRWTAPPPGPRATPGVVHIWRADLTAVGSGLWELLCAEEHERAAGILREGARARWACSRAMLRAVLGRYLDRDPRALRFELGQHGKPALRRTGPNTGPRRGDPDPAAGLRFNLSHSGELVLVAVTAGREIGVDVECMRERYTAELLRRWTVREATLKCLGTGLASAPPVPGANPVSGLWTAELDVGPQAVAAVAVAGEEACELRCWESAPTSIVLRRGAGP